MKLLFLIKPIKYLTFSSLALAVFGFFYFDGSWILRVIVLFFGLIAIWQADSLPELIATFTLYLGLYVLYNIRYGLAIPLAIIMAGVFLLTLLSFHFQSLIQKITEGLERTVYLTSLLVIALAILEIFLAMSSWPVDPKTKSVVIVIIFYLFSKLIYLNTNHVLNLKRAAGFIVASVVVLSIVITLSMRLGY